MRLILLASLLLFTNLSAAQQQDPLFLNFDRRDGLAGNDVTCLFQDDSGFLWIGTNSGLSKFNGGEFQNFFARTGSHRLTDDRITGIEQDARGRLWIVTKNGVNIMDASRDTIIQFFFPEKETPWSVNWCKTVKRHGEQMIVAREKLGFVVFDIDNLTFDDYYLNAYGEGGDVWNNIIQTIFIPEGQDSIVWLSSKNLVRFNLKTGQYQRFQDRGRDYALRLQYADDNDRFWCGTWGKGVWRFDPVNDRLENFDLPYTGQEQKQKGLNLSLTPRDSCSFWYASLDCPPGIYDFCVREAIEFEFDPKWAYSPTAEASQVVLEDRSGRIWIGSSEGISCMDPALQQFSNIRGRLFDEQGSTIGDWTLPVGGGRYYYTDEKNRLHFIHNETGERIEVKPIDEGFPWFHGALKLQDANVLYGVAGIHSLDTVKHTMFRGKYSLPGDLEKSRLYALMQLEQGDLLAGLAGRGLYRFSQQDLTWRQLPFDGDKLIVSLTEGEDGRIFISSQSNAYVYDLASGETREMAEQYPGSGDFAYLNGTSIDPKGRLWLTSDAYPTRIIARDGSVQTFADSIYVSEVYFEDDRGYFVSNKGFGEINLSSDSLVMYSEFDGLNSELLVNSWSSYIGPYDDGAIIFGTRYGWQVFHPRHQSHDREFDIYLKSAVHDGQEDGGHIRVPYDYDQLSIAVGVISYSLRHKTKLSYRLGPDKPWTPLSSDGELNLPGMAPGDYEVMFAAVNHQGEERISESIQVSIIPPFWQRWWFYALLVLFVAGFALFLNARRNRRMQERLKLEKEVLESDLRSLQAQMNPHFLFNSLNSIKSLIQKQDPKKAIAYLTTFSRLVRGILNAGSETFITLDRDVELLRQYVELESLRFSDAFHFVIDNQVEEDGDFILVPPLLTQVYVENAIWHGLMHKEGNRELTVRILPADDGIEIRVIDNGIGREQARDLRSKTALKEKSVGMNLARSRAQSLSKLYGRPVSIEVLDLQNEHGESRGTEVRITLPAFESELNA